MRIAKVVLLLLAAWLGLAASFSGCTCVVNKYYYGTGRPSAMYVAEAPPAPKDEARPAAPDEGMVWVGGYWEWSGSEEAWTWVAGAWTEPPDEGATWVEPDYEDNNGDWMYVPGHWKFDDPGAPEEEPPASKPGPLHWVGGHDEEPPGIGATTAPAAPEIPPGTFEAVEPKIPPGAFTTPPPKPDVPDVKLKAVELGEKAAPAPGTLQAVPPAGEDEDEDNPYAAAGGDEGGDGQGAKRPKKPDAPVLKPKKPEGPDVVEGGSGGGQPAAPEGAADEDRARKRHKKHRSSPEAKGDEDKAEPKAEPKTKPKHEPKVKEPDKVKPHR